MKKLFYFLMLFTVVTVTAQVPGYISYRAKAISSGIPLTTTNIGLRVSIVDVSSTVLYAETFNRTTDANGDYNLEIGNGTPVVTGTTLLNSVNWDTGDKFLKIEMDPSGGTSYTAVGQTQLLSVPYAFLAQKAITAEKAENVNANAGMVTVYNIASLKAFADFDISTDEPAVYVKGYDKPGDGGGGVFLFKAFENMGVSQPVEDLGIFIESDVERIKERGIWIRQFNGDVDVRWYGAFSYGEPTFSTISVTERIQKAINYTAASVQDPADRPYSHNRSNTVFLPNGNYHVTQLILKTGVSLKGASKEYTVINSSAIDPDNINDPNDPPNALFIIDSSAVRDVHISNLKLYGNMITEKACFFIKGVERQNEPGAGLWYSSFRNLYIQGFKGDSMHFEGGSGVGTAVNYNSVNQFIVFEGVYVESVGQLKKQDTNFYNYAHALSISGLNGQFSFNNCVFDGGSLNFSEDNENHYLVSGKNVYLGPVDTNPETHPFAVPSCMNFNTCTFQNGEIGIYIDSCRNINIYGGWFENFERAISVTGRLRPAKSINIMNNQYGRSAGRYGTVTNDTGSIISYENAQLNVMNNYVADHDLGNEQVTFIRLQDDQVNYPLLDWKKNGGVNTFGNSFLEDTDLDRTWGLNKVIYDAQITSTLMAENARLVTLYAEDLRVISKIDARIGAAEMINIRCAQGKIEFQEGDNIDLGNAFSPSNPLTINAGEIATFVKVEDIYNPDLVTYRLVSYNN